MKQLLSIRSSPRWIFLVHGIHTLCGLVFIVLDGVTLRYRMAGARYGGVQERLGPILLYAGYFLALLFALLCFSALAASHKGKLRVHAVAPVVKILACIACVALLFKLVGQVPTAIRWGLNDPDAPFRAHKLFATFFMFAWALFLTGGIVFRRTHASHHH